MSYQVLARKWRPRNFREMVGQEHVLRALINALDHDRLHHAYLFTGTRGVGKTTVARILAKCFNCEKGVRSEPCDECSSCRQISQGRSVDLLEVDAASRTKVEDTRELLENVQYAPTHSRYKVYLIDEVHMLSGHSFNALLKTLEEPPPHVKFLLATTDPQKLPATVLSRCLQFNLKNMPPEQIVSHLSSVLEQERISFEEPALWLLGRAAAGSMRDALSLTDQAIAFGSGQLREADVRSMLGTVDLSFVYQLLEAVSGGQSRAVLDVIANMAEHAPDFVGSLDELLSLLHRIAIAQLVPDAIDNRRGDAERVARLAGAITAEDIQLFYQIALHGKRDIGLTPDPREGFEMTALRMLAFRPAAVSDEASAQAVSRDAPPTASGVAGEVSTPAKKQHREPPAAPGPVAPAVEPGGSAALAAAADDASPTELNSGNWPLLLDKLGLAGMVYSIASHCELRERRGTALRFVLDQDHATLFNASHSDKIRLALENYLGETLTVAIIPGAVRAETPAARRSRLQRERQREAVAAIESDPQLRALIARFDGELDHASIVPTDR
ncbi:MAG: DNA polymerase III subunit gamma/tau [Halioglobus sp.]|nr:DNA polymerase III subunit gamma/tau [Halioglobus sp.]